MKRIIRPLAIGFTYDLRSEYTATGYSEEETAELDSDITVIAVENALKSFGHSVERIGSIRSLVSLLAKGKRWDLVFNIAEGMNGTSREAQVPALLDAYQIPYVFSEPLTLCVALDKPAAKRLVRDRGVQTPAFFLAEKLSDLEGLSLPFPLFCKPAAEGSSKGVGVYSYAENLDQLKESVSMLLQKFNQPILIEEYLPGKEYTVGIIGTGAEARILGVMEIVLNMPTQEGYSYKNKLDYLDMVKYRLAGEKEAKECGTLALNAWRALNCRDGGRVDIKYNATGHPAFIEVNPLAGLNPEYSDLPILCGLLQIHYSKLIEEILDSAVKRLP